MKKYILIIISTLAMTCFSLAESGWPDFITSAYYHSENNSIWYIKQYYDGRWGIKIREYSIKDHSTKILNNIAWVQYEENMDGTIKTSNEEIEVILTTMWLTKLTQVHIDKMPIYFTLKAYQYEVYTDTGTVLLHKGDFSRLWKSIDLYRTVWRNKVYVNNRLQNITTITTCGLDPINYRWLALPWTNFMAIIVTSQNKDCREGWYIGETVFVVKYLRMYKKYFTWPHSNLYAKIYDDDLQLRYNSNNNEVDDDHKFLYEDGPLVASIGWLYADKLKSNKENIIKKR